MSAKHSILAFAVLILVGSVGSAENLSDFLVSENQYLIGLGDSLAVDEIHLDSTGEADRPIVIQQGDVSSSHAFRLDDGVWRIESGTLTTSDMMLGDPAATPIVARNSGQLTISGAGFEPLPTPFPISQLTVRSASGSLVPIPDEAIGDVPFDVTSNTPSLITLETGELPVLVNDWLTLPIQFGMGAQEFGDVLITVGDGDRRLNADFRQEGGTVEVRGNLELCVPVDVGTPIVDASRGITNRVRYEKSGGELDVEGQLVIASSGAVPAEFVQTAGKVTAREVSVGGLGGSLQLLGGSLETDRLFAGGSTVFGDGASVVANDITIAGSFEYVNDHDSAIVRVKRSLSFGDWIDTENAPGLLNTNFVFDTDSSQDVVLSYYDISNGPLAFGRMQIGGSSPSTLRFEAYGGDIHVGSLELTAGSTLIVDETKLVVDELILGDMARVLYTDCNEDRLHTAADLRCMTADFSDYLLDQIFVGRGDFNADSVVNFLDFLVLAENFGRDDVDYTTGDADVNGVVDFNDFLIVAQNFGQETGWDRSEELSAVPEPSATCMLLTGLATIAFRRRRHYFDARPKT